MLEWVWMIPLGFAAGLLGSIVGLGGGVVIVPALSFAGFHPALAASNSLFAAFGNAAASSITYARQGRIEYRTGLRLGLLCVPGTVLGAYVSAAAAPDVFKALFGMLLAASALYVLLRRRIGTRKSTSWPAALLTAGASFGAGIVSSYFGVGGGVVFVPLMVGVMGLGMRRAAPTSQFVLLFASFSGMVTHSALGHPDFYQALLLTAGASGGGLLGARLSLDMRERGLRILVSVVMAAVAARLFVDSWV